MINISFVLPYESISLDQLIYTSLKLRHVHYVLYVFIGECVLPHADFNCSYDVEVGVHSIPVILNNLGEHNYFASVT